MHAGLHRHHRVDEAGVRVDTDVRLHGEEPLVPLPGPVHLRTTCANPVPCRARGTGGRRIDRRAPADHLATPPEQGVDLLDECGGQVVALEEVAEAQDGGGVRGAGGAGVDSRKRPAERDVAQVFLGGLIGEREPQLQEVDPQQQQYRLLRASRGPCQGERDNPGATKASHGTSASISTREACRSALGGTLETVREAQLVHATTIPGQATPPLPSAVNAKATILDNSILCINKAVVKKRCITSTFWKLVGVILSITHTRDDNMLLMASTL